MENRLKSLEDKVDKLIALHDEHDKMTNRLSWGFKIQNIVIGFVFTIGTVLMFTLSQMIPLMMEVLSK